jgi:hypothetical protein
MAKLMEALSQIMPGFWKCCVCSNLNAPHFTQCDDCSRPKCDDCTEY